MADPSVVTYELLSNEGLAFDHGKIIAYGLERLHQKTSQRDIVFHLMPEQFTLTQLQQVYEVILDRPLLKAAFRRQVAPLVVQTDHYTENAGHRPSRLYRRILIEQGYGRCFDEIIFAVLDGTKEGRCRKAFQSVFSERSD